MGMLQFLKLSYVLIGNSVATQHLKFAIPLSIPLPTQKERKKERKKESSHLFKIWKGQPISVYSVFAVVAQWEAP